MKFNLSGDSITATSIFSPIPNRTKFISKMMQMVHGWELKGQKTRPKKEKVICKFMISSGVSLLCIGGLFKYLDCLGQLGMRSRGENNFVRRWTKFRSSDFGEGTDCKSA